MRQTLLSAQRRAGVPASRLITVVIRLVGAIDGPAHVIGLVFGGAGSLTAGLAQWQTGDVLFGVCWAGGFNCVKGTGWGNFWWWSPVSRQEPVICLAEALRGGQGIQNHGVVAVPWPGPARC